VTSAITEFLDADGWAYTADAAGVVTTAVRAEAGEWYVQVWWLAATEQLLVYSILPIPVPPHRVEAVAAVCGRANAQLSVASFEVDLADGETRCRVGVAVAGDELTPGMVRRAVLANVAATDRYLPTIVQVVAGAAPLTTDFPTGG